MDLNAYTGRLTRDLYAVAGTGNEEVAEVAERFAGVLESSVRVVLLDAVVEADAEISRELTPGSVEVRLHGRDVGFAVTPAHGAAGPHPASPTAPVPAGAAAGVAAGAVAAPSDEDDADGGTARLSLRLPERLKPKVEQAAAAAGLSVNAWLVRSIGALVEAPAPVPSPAPAAPLTGQRHTGWVR